MKGVVVMLVAVSFCIGNVNAQGIFNQKGSQLKRLAEQVALLHTYSGYLKKGYSIARKGLKTINDIKNGDLNLHKAFFNSLKAVNPAIKRYSKVGDIVVLQIKTIKHFSLNLRNLRNSGFLKHDELEYINSVLQGLIQDCIGLIDELTLITTSGNLEMSDDERLKRIDQLYEIALDQLTFSEEFCQEAIQMGRSRMLEMKDIKTVIEMAGNE